MEYSIHLITAKVPRGYHKKRMIQIGLKISQVVAVAKDPGPRGHVPPLFSRISRWAFFSLKSAPFIIKKCPFLF